MTNALDNITWNALVGPHARFAAGSGDVRRYAAGFSPILGFKDRDRPDFQLLERLCAPGEPFYTAFWKGPAPEGWTVDVDSTMRQMLWRGGVPEDEAPEAVALDARHASQALALAELTHPGPFGPRTIELGDYFGLFEGDRLVAMAGERMQAGDLHEISGVCTHPDYQGRGLARRLVAKLLRRQLQRGEKPFLHVMSANKAARGLYERMGFADDREVVVRVITRRKP